MKWNELVNHWGLDRTAKKEQKYLNEIDEVGSVSVTEGSEDKIRALSEKLRDQLEEVLVTLNDMSWAQCEYEEIK